MKVLPQPMGDRSGQICNENIAFKILRYLLTKVFMVKKNNYQLIFQKHHDAFYLIFFRYKILTKTSIFNKVTI